MFGGAVARLGMTYSIGAVRLELEVLCICSIVHDDATRARSGGPDGKELDKGHGQHDDLVQAARIMMQEWLITGSLSAPAQMQYLQDC